MRLADETTAQHARDRQEARRLRAHQGLEAVPVEAKHAAPSLRADRGGSRLPGQERHLAKEVPGAEAVDPSGDLTGRVLDVDSQPPGGEHEQAVARLTLAADGLPLLEHDRIEVRGELGEREPVDLSEERHADQDVLEVGLLRETERGRHGVTASGSGR